MMKWKKILALILGSPWFFPVSCTSTNIAGIHVIAHLDARDVARGDIVHSSFAIAVEPGKQPDQAFRLVLLDDLPALRAKPAKYSLLMSKPSGRVDTRNNSYIAYRVIEDHNSIQVIEVEDHGDDAYWSRYRTNGIDVTPLSSRLNHHGYMFAAFPYAFGISLLLYAIGRILRRKIRKT